MRPQVISNGSTGKVLIAAGAVALLSAVILIPISLSDDSPPYYYAWHDWPFCIFIGLLFAGGVSFAFMVRSQHRGLGISVASVFAAGCVLGAALSLNQAWLSPSPSLRVGALVAALGLLLGASGTILGCLRPRDPQTVVSPSKQTHGTRDSRRPLAEARRAMWGTTSLVLCAVDIPLIAGFLLLASQHEGSDPVDFTLVEVLCVLGGGTTWLASMVLGVGGLARPGSSRRRAVLSLCINALLVLSWRLTFLR